MIIDIVTNAKRGIKYGFINRAISLLLPFFVQSVLIKTLGIEYVGLKGLFSSLLSILSLSELGFGSAISFSMYKPIASDDINTLCALLNYYRKTYRFVGFIVLVIGIAVMPFLEFFINGSCPENINVHILFLLYLINTVLSYWCHAYKSSVLNAYQRTDLLSNVSTVSTIMVSLLQILTLLFFKNFYLFITISILGNIFNNLIISYFVNRLFPEITCVGSLSKDDYHNIKVKAVGIFISKVCYITRYSFDTIFVSVFYGLTQTALYVNYFAVITALNGFTSIITNSLLAGIGNNVALYSKEKNFDDMMRIDNVYLIISGWMTICLICLYQPFMTLWAGKDYLLPVSTMILFPIYFYVKKMTEIRGVYASAAGLFWEDKNRNILEAIANIILNYLLVRKFGVFGVMFATLLTFCTFGYFGSVNVIFKHYFKCGKGKYYVHQLKCLLITIVVACVTVVICKFGVFSSTIGVLLFRFLICITLTPLMYWVILHNCSDFKIIKDWCLTHIKE